MSNNPNAMTKILTAIDNVVNAQHVLEIEIRSLKEDVGKLKGGMDVLMMLTGKTTKAARAESPYSGITDGGGSSGRLAEKKGPIIHFCENPGCSYSTLKKQDIEQHQRMHQTGAGGKRASRRKFQHRRSTRKY